MKNAGEAIDRPILDGERALAARYGGGTRPRIVLTLLAFVVAWTAVVILGINGGFRSGSD